MTRFIDEPRGAKLDASTPLERPPLPYVHLSDREDGDEHQHLDQQEPHPGSPCGEEDRPPRDQEHRLDVEDDEQHRHEVELHREALVRVAERSEEHTSELQSPYDLVCRLLLEKQTQKPEFPQPLKKQKYSQKQK